MLSKIIIFVDNKKSHTYGYNESNQLEYYLIDDEKLTSNHGVFLAKVINIHSKNNLAWINYESDRVGVINLPKNYNLQSGSQIVCQMDSVANLDKMPKFSSEIKLAGKYVVLLSNVGHHYANGLLNHDKLALISQKYQHLGIIFRSSINTLSDLSLVEQEINLLSLQLASIYKHSSFGLILSGIPRYIELLYKYSDGCEVITNNEDVFDRLKSCLDLWGIEELSFDSSIQVPNIKTSNIIVLKNGVKFTLHQLSGINLIDIDSGSSNLSFYQVNYLAIEDIVKQIKLHDLRGIILIDFIKNMSNKEQSNIIDKLKSLLQDDWRRNKVLGFTRAQICEIIRSK